MRVMRNLGLVGGLLLWLVCLPSQGVAQEARQAQPSAAAAADAAPASNQTTANEASATPSANEPATNQPPADQPPTDQAAPQLETRAPRYQVHAGDSFDITFELSPEFNQTGVTIQPDGFVTLRGVGDLKVDGQTVPQLTETLQTEYSKILHDPIISVTLKDFEKPYFIADGQIGHPGKYDLRGTVTLTQALAIAGGLSDSAKHSQVMLFRRVNDQWLEAKLFNVKKMEKSGKLDEDPFLHSGDMVFVPKNTISKFSRFIPQASLGAMLAPY
jgi:polysaccharide biosynthesis/export protein